MGALRILEAADEDGDRSVARAEFDALADEEFAWRDRNDDGALDEADLSPVVRRLAAARERSDDDDGRPMHRPRFARAARMDADDDGRVTREEFLEARTRVFERLDADADGVITPDELDEFVEQRRDRGRWWRDR